MRWTLWSGQNGVVSHETALAVHDLGDVNPAQVHMSVPPGFRAKAAGVVLHRAVVPPAEKQEHSGFWVTSPLRSLIDVASGSLDLDQIVTAVREALERGLVTARRLRAGADGAGDRAALRIERALAAIEVSRSSPQASLSLGRLRRLLVAQRNAQQRRDQHLRIAGDDRSNSPCPWELGRWVCGAASLVQPEPVEDRPGTSEMP